MQKNVGNVKLGQILTSANPAMHDNCMAARDENCQNEEKKSPFGKTSQNDTLTTSHTCKFELS
jgi:hypothetical protein